MAFRRTSRHLPPIDKRNADPELLWHYSELRNERRLELFNSRLKTFLTLFIGFSQLFVIGWVIFIYPKHGGVRAIYVLTGITIVLTFCIIGVSSIWAPYGQKLSVLGELLKRAIFVGLAVIGAAFLWSTFL
jgi:hypothetical protein